MPITTCRVVEIVKSQEGTELYLVVTEVSKDLISTKEEALFWYMIFKIQGLAGVRIEHVGKNMLG